MISGVRLAVMLVLPAAALLLSGCGSSGEPTRPPAPPPSKESVFREGNLLYAQRQYDTAAVLLRQAYGMDSSYLDPALALAALYFDLGKEAAAGSKKANESYRQSQRYYRIVVEAGRHDAEVLDRLCEVSLLLRDDRAFARYAKKNADLYPYERQTYNLGLAYFGVEDFQNVVKTQKEAIDKFRTSAYLGGYYRLLGLAYVKQGRDQTAERTFLAGIKAVESRIAEVKRAEPPATEDLTRLSDDRVAMLQQLRRLFQIYKKQEDLERVERQLRDAGQLK